MSIFAVVPILPTLASLLFLLPVLALSTIAALASLGKPAVALAVVRLMWRQKFPLLILVGMAFTAAPALRWLEVRFTPQAAAASGADWPTSRGSLARRGWTGDRAGPTRGGIVWSGGRPSEAFYASPAVVGNRVYGVGSRDDRGVIYCWDAETGSRIWSSAPRGYRATFSSPVVSGRYLVCGEGLHRTNMARVVCMDLSTNHEGSILWTFSTSSHVECTPLIVAGRVYVGAGDDGVYCLALDANISDAERVIWHASGTQYPDVETSLAVYDGKVYIGLGNEGHAICVLNAESGIELARVEMPFPVFSPPAIDRGKLFVGMGNGDYVHLPDKPAGQVCCLDLSSCRIEWTFATGATVLGAIVAADDQIVFGCADGYLYILSRDGQLLGKWDSHAAVLAAPAVTNDQIYLLNQTGMLYALDRRRLDPLWEVRLGRSGRFVSSPVIARGHVFVGTEEDGFLCLGVSGGEPQPELWPGHLGGAGITGGRDGSLLPSDVSVRWNVTRIEPSGASIEVTGPIAARTNCLLVPVTDGSRSGLACIEPDNQGTVRWFFESPNAIVLSPACSGGYALVVDGQRGDAHRHLNAIELSSGRLVWKRAVESAASGVLTVSLDSLFLQDTSDTLCCLSLNGHERWRLPMGPVSQGVDASTAILVAACESPACLVAMDRASGAVLWRESLDAAPTTAPAVQKDRICLGTQAGVESRRLVDGRRLWHLAGESAKAIQHTPDHCTFINAKGELVITDAMTGRVRGRSAVAAPGSIPLVSGNGILVVADQQLRRLGAGGEVDGARMFGPAELGTPTSPLVLQESCVYLGVRGRGVVCLGGKPDP